MKIAKLLEAIFKRAYVLYNGLSEYDELPRISGRFYVRKPKIYTRRNPRTKNVSYYEILVEIPQSRPATPPEYILLIIHVSMNDRLRPRDLERIHRFINMRFRKARENVMGTVYSFIYIVCKRYTSGAYDIIKRNYARLRNHNMNIVLKILRYSEEDQIIHDLKNYIESRIKGLLDKKKYVKSKYEIFSYPKRLLEYFLILDALLNRRSDIASQVAQLLHHTYRLPVDQYIKLFYYINNKEEEIRSKEEIRSFPKPTPYI